MPYGVFARPERDGCGCITGRSCCLLVYMHTRTLYHAGGGTAFAGLF